MRTCSPRSAPSGTPSRKLRTAAVPAARTARTTTAIPMTTIEPRPRGTRRHSPAMHRCRHSTPPTGDLCNKHVFEQACTGNLGRHAPCRRRCGQDRRPRRSRAQPAEHQRRAAAQQARSCSPGCPARASRAWRSTRSTPRASAATSRASAPTPASSSGRWTSPTSTSSRGCRRRSRSTRSRPAATRARRSARSPRSTTTCACCTPGSACSTARTTAPGCSARRRSRSSTASSLLPEGTRFQVLAPVVRGRKGEYDTLLEDLAGSGLRARPDRRRGRRHRRVPQARRAAGPLRAAHTSRSSSTASCAATGSSGGSPTRWRQALRLAEGVAEVELVAARRRGDSEIAHVQPAPRLPGVRHVVRRAGAAQLLVQLAVRRVRGVRRARHARSRSTPSWSSPTPTVDQRRRDRPVAHGATRSTSHGCSKRWPTTYDIDLDAPYGEAHRQAAEGHAPRRRGQPQGQVQEPLRPQRASTAPRTRA